MTTFEILKPFAVALILGALLGFERAFTSRIHDDSGDVLGGIRTFSLISLFGCAAAFLDSSLKSCILLISLIGIIAITSISYAVSYFRDGEGGITTEISILITFAIGVMAHLRLYAVAAALTIVVALVLYLKGSTEELNRRLESGDILAVLKFAIISFVILPLFDPAFSVVIGDAPLVASFLAPGSPLAAIELINPHTVWLMVVLISAIGFTGYLSTKILGSRKGIGLTGLLGGLVSSTATTIEFAKRSRDAAAHSLPYALAVFLACSTMFPRILVEVMVINPRLLGPLSIPMGAMALGGFAVSFFIWKISGSEKTDDVPMKNPFYIMPAVKFGLLYAAIVLFARVMEAVAGQGGLYIVSALSGLTDVDAITLTMGQISRQDPSKNSQAAVAITIAAFSNTVMKCVMAVAIGSGRLRKAAILGFAAILFAGTAGLAVLYFIA